MLQTEEDGALDVQHLSTSLKSRSYATGELQETGSLSDVSFNKPALDVGPPPLYGNIRKLGRTWSKLSSIRIWKERFMVIEDHAVRFRPQPRAITESNVDVDKRLG
jgi:hypothetical protein